MFKIGVMTPNANFLSDHSKLQTLKWHTKTVVRRLLFVKIIQYCTLHEAYTYLTADIADM